MVVFAADINTTTLFLTSGATVVAAIFGSSVLTAWITQRSQRPLTAAQAQGEQADAAAVIITASNEFVRNVVDRVEKLELKVRYLEMNQARLIAQLVEAGIKPDLVTMPLHIDDS